MSLKKKLELAHERLGKIDLVCELLGIQDPQYYSYKNGKSNMPESRLNILNTFLDSGATSLEGFKTATRINSKPVQNLQKRVEIVDHLGSNSGRVVAVEVKKGARYDWIRETGNVSISGEEMIISYGS